MKHESEQPIVTLLYISTFGVELWKTLQEHEVKIAAYAFRNGAIQVSEAQRLTGRTWQTSKKDLDKLTRKGILEFEPGRYVRDPKAIYKLKKRPTNDVSPNGNG